MSAFRDMTIAEYFYHVSRKGSYHNFVNKYAICLPLIHAFIFICAIFRINIIFN